MQSEEKAASLRCRGERGEVAPLIGVHRGQQVDTRQWRALLSCAPIQVQHFPSERTRRAAKPRFPQAVCGREGERARMVIALLWMERTEEGNTLPRGLCVYWGPAS